MYVAASGDSDPESDGPGRTRTQPAAPDAASRIGLARNGLRARRTQRSEPDSECGGRVTGTGPGAACEANRRVVRARRRPGQFAGAPAPAAGAGRVPVMTRVSATVTPAGPGGEPRFSFFFLEHFTKKRL
jgi:hypothetical protein